MAVHRLLMRGMLVGMFAGLIAFGFARIVGEPSLEGGIAFEEAAHAHHHPGEVEEPELVSRPVQQNIGLPIGAVVYGGAIGGLFALIFAFAYGRLGRLSPKGMAAILALLCFAVFFASYLKYPANPPGANEAETIGVRTGLYFSMLAISIVAMAVALSLRRLVETRLGAWNATLVAGLAFLLLTAIGGYLMPSVNETPTEFPAATLWAFRLSSLGIQAILWAVIGIAFGLLTERSLKA